MVVGDDGMDAPLIPYDRYSVCKGMREVVLSNVYMWCRAGDVVDIALVQEANMVQYGCSMLGGVEGVHNSFVLYSNCHYKYENSKYLITYSSVNSRFEFSHQHPSLLCHHSPSFNDRVLTQFFWFEASIQYCDASAKTITIQS